MTLFQSSAFPYVLSIFTLWIILRKLPFSVCSKNERKFRRLVICSIIFIVFDFLTSATGPNNWGFSRNMMIILHVVYFVLSGATPFFWFLYAESVQESRLVQTKKSVYICSIPFVLLTILSLASFRWNIIFHFDGLDYHRGPFYFLQLILSYGYLALPSTKAIVKSFQKKNYAKKSEYLGFASFVFFPFLFGTAQVFFVGVPLIIMGITLAILAIFVNFQDFKISVDGLTRINNRNSMMVYLSSKLNRTVNDHNLYLLILDVDYFKKINDTAGHTEGDNVLMIIASLLKTACAPYNCFLSRYGGDEFIIIFETNNMDDIKLLKEKIHSSVAEAFEKDAVSYKVGVSIGAALWNETITSIPDFIALADVELYKEKEIHHQQLNA